MNERWTGVYIDHVQLDCLRACAETQVTAAESMMMTILERMRIDPAIENGTGLGFGQAFISTSEFATRGVTRSSVRRILSRLKAAGVLHHEPARPPARVGTVITVITPERYVRLPKGLGHPTDREPDRPPEPNPTGKATEPDRYPTANRPQTRKKEREKKRERKEKQSKKKPVAPAAPLLDAAICDDNPRPGIAQGDF